MIQPTRMVDPDQVDLSPQAVLKQPVSFFARFGNVTYGRDDLDEFEGGSFLLDNNLLFAIMHYNGHPPGTSTIYLPASINNVEVITRLVHDIVLGFGLEEADIDWERADDPDL